MERWNGGMFGGFYNIDKENIEKKERKGGRMENRKQRYSF
jgi:hypothetical protein